MVAKKKTARKINPANKSRGRNAHNDKVHLEAVKRKTDILNLRISGASFTKIAETIGVTPQAVMKVWRETMEEHRMQVAEKVGEARQVELDRLDTMQLHQWPEVLKGSEKAVRAVIRIMERRAKLMGLDAPVKVAPTNIDGDKPYEPITEQERFDRLMAIIDRARERGGQPATDNTRVKH